MMLNIKKGLRRIVISIISLITTIVLCYFIASGCIWEMSKFENNVFIKSLQTEKQITLFDFVRLYLPPKNSSWLYGDLICKPYNQECYLYGYDVSFKNTEQYDLHNINSNFKKGTFIKIIMPSRFQYFLWQTLDLIAILSLAILTYFCYLIIEFLIFWIIKGFKNE